MVGVLDVSGDDVLRVLRDHQEVQERDRGDSASAVRRAARVCLVAECADGVADDDADAVVDWVADVERAPICGRDG